MGLLDRPGCRRLYHHGADQVNRNIPVLIVLIVKYLCFRFFENQYFSIIQSVLQEIVDQTGCLPPCSYTEYRFEKTPSDFGENNATRELILWLSTPYVLLETEQYLYPFKSLVADVGGTFGLFLGFSLMTLWEYVEILIKIVSTIMKNA